MQRTFGVTLAALFGAVALPALAADGGAYKVPHNELGQPDLNGTWSNASLTPLTRNPLFGTRSVASPAEVKAFENGNSDRIDAANAKSDLSVSINNAANVGAYNEGWIDGGSRMMRVHGEPRTSVLTTPDGLEPPAKGQPPHAPPPPGAGSAEAGLRAIKELVSFDKVAAQGVTSRLEEDFKNGQLDNPESRPTSERCIISGRNAGPPMISNGWYNNNYQLVQSRDAVVIDVEMDHDARVVHLNAKHRTDGIRPWFGDSIGHYEGDILVVETINIPQRQAYNGSWQNLKVTEKFTRVAKDRMLYQFTIDDPTMWDKPWGGEYEFSPTNGRIMEYACHEGNYALEGVLAGARQKELEATAVAKPVAAK